LVSAYTDPGVVREQAESADETDCDMSLDRCKAGDVSRACDTERTPDDERLSETSTVARVCGTDETSDLTDRLSGLLFTYNLHIDSKLVGLLGFYNILSMQIVAILCLKPTVCHTAENAFYLIND